MNRFAAAAAALCLIAACSESPVTGLAPNTTPRFAAGGNGNENGNKLQCFSGTTDTQQNPGYGPYNGTCTLTSNGAVLNTVDNDGDPNNAYAGVYIQNSNLGGKLLSEVNKLAFSYSGTGATGGSPRISIPIDANGDGSYDGFAFIDTQGCNDGNPNTGTLDAINDATCTVAYGNALYPNWAAFTQANPTYRIASDAVTFIVVDQPGSFTISNVQLGKGPARGAK